MHDAVFTARDLSRSPAKVLEACDHLGSVRIRTRSGKTYCLKPEDEPATKNEAAANRIIEWPDFAARRQEMRALGAKPLNKKQTERFDRWLGGEE
jgi:hypothetical protein